MTARDVQDEEDNAGALDDEDARLLPLPWRSIIPVYTTSLIVPVDDGVILPSLWGYVESLHGRAASYGFIMLAFYLVRAVAMPTIGRRVDCSEYKTTCALALLVGLFASLLYAWAPVLGGIPVVIVARALHGCSCACSVACLAYIADHVPPQKRVGAYAISFALQCACVPMAPLVNILICKLPQTQFGPFPLTKFTYAGYFIALVNLVLLCALSLLREPKRRVSRLEAPKPTISEIFNTVRRSGAYVSYFLSFQNNWTNQTVMWTIPIITSQFFPYLGIAGNSCLMASGGLFAAISILVTPLLFRKWQDRSIILLMQLTVGATIVPFALFFGHCQNLAPGDKPALWVLVLLYCLYNGPFLAQMPANNAIYTKLVGSVCPGVYMSLLEMAKTLGRAFAGEMIGVTYGWLGPNVLWSVTLSIWALQFVPFLWNWNRLATKGGVVVGTGSETIKAARQSLAQG